MNFVVYYIGSKDLWDGFIKSKKVSLLIVK